MIFVCLRILSERKWVAGRTGSIVFLYCILYGVVRWCEELLRDQRVHWHLMTTAQFICVGMFIFGFVGLAVSLRRPALRNALVRQEPSLPNRRQRRREMLARRKTSWKGGDNTA
jgi:prolipoprotein diacylglyceryltransferase